MQEKKIIKKQTVSTKKRKTKKGFSLIESLVAVLIFSMAITMIAGTFSSFLRNYSNAKKTQRSFENAQYAMNLMAKSIRTSTLINIDPVNKILRIFDYSQVSDNCIQYSYTSPIITRSSATAANSAACTTATVMTSTSSLTDGSITGMYIEGVASNPATPSLGKITIALIIKEAGQATSSLPIQMTVSLRQ